MTTAPVGGDSDPDVKLTRFSGFEARIAVRDGPLLRDMLPPGREFLPEAVSVLHYDTGHWGGRNPWTEVSVVGGLIEDSRRPGRVEWDTNQRELSPQAGDMPEWVRSLVREKTGVDLSGWRPEVRKATPWS